MSGNNEIVEFEGRELHVKFEETEVGRAKPGGLIKKKTMVGAFCYVDVSGMGEDEKRGVVVSAQSALRDFSLQSWDGMASYGYLVTKCPCGGSVSVGIKLDQMPGGPFERDWTW